jgi:hypothetical protein
MTGNSTSDATTTLTTQHIIKLPLTLPFTGEPEERADALNRIARALLIFNDQDGDPAATVAALTAVAAAAGLAPVVAHYDNNAQPDGSLQPLLEVWEDTDGHLYTLRYPQSGPCTLIEHGPVGFDATSMGWYKTATAICFYYVYNRKAAAAV